MDRLVRDDRKTTVTQITTRYNQDLQNTISEHTTHRTLKQMDFLNNFECFKHLVECMPRRIKTVLKAKDGPTRY